MEVQPFKLYIAFTDDEASAFWTALAQHLDPDDAQKPSWQKRGAQAADGQWLLGWNEPAAASLRNELGDYSDRPWAFPNSSLKGGPVSSLISNLTPGLLTVTRFAPIADAVALLKSDRSPELEVLRRKRLFDEALERDRDRADAEAKGDAERKKAQAEHVRRRPERWVSLPRDIKALYVAAANASLQGLSSSQTFVRLAELLRGSDVALAAPPTTFEPAEGR
jgi:hypothetical protein